MNFADLKRKSEKELHRFLQEKRNELRELKFKVSEGQLKKVNTIREVRTSIAQVLTLLNSQDKDQTNN